MTTWLPIAMAAIAGAWWAWRGALLHRRALEQLAAAVKDSRPVTATEPVPQVDRARRPVYPRRHRWVIPVVGLAVAAALRLLVALPLQVSAAFGLLFAVFSYLIEEAIASARTARIETQLAEAIDMLVASLRAGSAMLAGFEATLHDARPPLRDYLEEIVGRIRLGDDPREVILALADEVPLETFRLFAMSLAIHWEVGGSLASTLATVGRTIRDRVELDRRVRAQGVEAHASVAAVMIITYVLAYLMWKSTPDRMEAFVRSAAGTTMVALVVGLQAVGIIWMARLSRSGF